MLSLDQLDELDNIRHALAGLSAGVMFASRMDDAAMEDDFTNYAGIQLYGLAERLDILCYQASEEREAAREQALRTQAQPVSQTEEKTAPANTSAPTA